MSSANYPRIFQNLHAVVPFVNKITSINHHLSSTLCQLNPSLFVVSIFCTVMMFVLITFELRAYNTPRTHSELFVSTRHQADTFHANIDITFSKVPCDIIGLNSHDALGNQKNDVQGDLRKHRLDSNGNSLSVETWDEKSATRQEIRDRTQKEIRENQGCRFEGFIELKRVPGQFYISTFDFSDILSNLAMQGFTLD